MTAVPHIACAHAGYFFEQIAPGRVSGHAQNGTLICRADANATAGAGFDPADPAFYAVGGQGNEVARRSVANKPVESGTNRRGKSENFPPKFAPKAARRAEELGAGPGIQFRESISRSKLRRYDSPCTVSRCGSFSPSR